MAYRIFQIVAACVVGALAAGAFAMENGCSAQSGSTVTPVIELYTSEGCSSCPPADHWLSGFKPATRRSEAPVIEAFHVGYWDNLGWVDRFANPAYTERQRQIASWNRQRSVYTPQAVFNGQDWRDWYSTGNTLPLNTEPAHITIQLKQSGVDQFEALLMEDGKGPAAWSAYWTVTEHDHSSKVKAGENAGEFLQHDYVVRQYTLAGDYRSDPGQPRKLGLRAIAATPGHARRINLVVFDGKTGKTLQAVSAGC